MLIKISFAGFISSQLHVLVMSAIDLLSRSLISLSFLFYLKSSPNWPIQEWTAELNL